MERVVFLTSGLRTGTHWIAGIMQQVLQRPLIFWGENFFGKGDTRPVADSEKRSVIRTHYAMPSDIRRHYPDAYIVVIVRNILDSLTSLWFYWLHDPMGWCNGEKPPGNNIKQFVRSEWVKNDIERRLDYLADVAGMLDDKRFLRVTFDYMVSIPDYNVVQKLCDLFNIDMPEGRKERIKMITSFQHKTGGRNEGEEDEESFFRTGAVGSWEKHLDRDDVDYLNGVIREIVTRKGIDILKGLEIHTGEV